MTDQEIVLAIRQEKEHKALAKLYNNLPSVTKLVESKGGTKEDVYYYNLIENGILSDGTRVTVNPQQKTWEEIELLLEAL